MNQKMGERAPLDEEKHALREALREATFGIRPPNGRMQHRIVHLLGRHGTVLFNCHHHLEHEYSCRK